MSFIRIKGICIENYRSFGEKKNIIFPSEEYRKPVAIVGYNNAGKTNLLNAILIGVTEKYMSKDKLSLNDFHNRDFQNKPYIFSGLKSSREEKANGRPTSLTGYHFLKVDLDGSEIENVKIESYSDYKRTKLIYGTYGAAKYYKIFYINFHEIKKEISTKKTSWGNLTSFLAKHIKNLVDSDKSMLEKKALFKDEIAAATGNVMHETALHQFIEKIQNNYSKNLRDNECKIEFSLPDYEDIFLEMMFKVGLNGDSDNLIPVEHFGDGYISMFVMAVIQAIAETNNDDRCLFLFEEPESFLHENHQEYFYKTVLCGLAENGHQVIYTTHSDKMIDIFDTKGLIRLEFDETKKQTEVTYNNVKDDFSPGHTNDEETIDKIKDFNNYIKIIEPNLNKIIFSKKVILVEGPNDLLVYNEVIRKKVLELTGDNKYAETYLNFKNISIIPHHGKPTAQILIKLCKHLGIEYFVINDFDFNENVVSELNYATEEAFKASKFYLNKIPFLSSCNAKGEERNQSTKKAMMTVNWRLLNSSSQDNIHFNIPKLEKVIGYDSDDKDSIGIWKVINKMESISEELVPENLWDFLEIRPSEVLDLVYKS